MQILVDSGFIAAAELGRVAQVSTELNRATSEDSVWASLCQRDYPATSRFKRSFLDGGGYRWMYKRWSCPIAKRRRPLSPLEDPPSCTAKQIFVCAHIRYDGKSALSAVLSGHQLDYLLEDGAICWDFAEPFVIGKAEWNYSERQKLDYEAETNSANRSGLPVKCNAFDADKLDATIHVISSSASRGESMSRVFDSSELGRPSMTRSPSAHPRLEQGETLTQETKYDTTRDDECGSIIFTIPRDKTFSAWPLRDSKEAALIQERIEHPLFFKMKIRVGAIKGGNFVINGFDLFVCKSGIPDSKPRYPVFRSSEEKEKHGVTLLHILSELQDM